MGLLNFFGWSKPSDKEHIGDEERYKKRLENQHKQEIKEMLSSAMRKFAKNHRIDITDTYESNKIGYESIVRNVDKLSLSECTLFIDGKSSVIISSKGVILRRNNAAFVMQSITLKKNEKNRVNFATQNRNQEEFY